MQQKNAGQSGTYAANLELDPRRLEKSGPRFVLRLGRHHFAHLRATAEGLDLIDSAKRYLGVEHGHQARTAHLQTVDRVRAIARRSDEVAWRLIGLTIRLHETANDACPSLDEFIASRNLDGWSESEVAEMYAEAFPIDAKATRRIRLRERQLALLARLEQLAAEQPQPGDAVGGWFDEVTAAKLVTAGMITLGELGARIATGGRWWRSLPAIGATKAHRIAAHLFTLLPEISSVSKPFFPLAQQQARDDVPRLNAAAPLSLMPTGSTSPLAQATAESEPSCLLDARNDREAIEAWIAARAGSVATAKTYRREAMRLLLWLQHERQSKQLATMGVGDCGDYMAFLQDIPSRWISRERAAPGEPGWAPFRGQLSHQSHRQAVVVVAAMFTWLQSARYLTANPWVLVNQKTGDDRQRKLLDTKALSESASLEVLRFIEAQPPSPSRERIAFIVRFLEAVGLRSAELLGARIGDVQLEPEGWVMQVHGKGARNRLVAIPGQGFDALQRYLSARGLGGIEIAPPDAPLLASTRDPVAAIGYQALYEHVKSWISKAVSASALPSNERLQLAGATTHWLRHTFGTRAIAREVPLDVIQAQMGHASIQTTTSIYGRAPIKRRVDELKKAFR